MSSELDDELTRMLRAANPVPHRGDVSLSMRELAIRDRIMAGSRTRPRTRRPALWTAVWAPIAAIAVVVLAVITVPQPQTAVALAPAPLAFQNEGLTMTEVVLDARRALERATGPVEPTREVTSTGWYYHVDALDSDEPRRVISPEVTTLSWREDLSGHTRTVAGEPYWADGAQESVPSTTLEPGTLIWEMDFAPGEFQAFAVAVPGDTREDVRRLLNSHWPTNFRSAYDVMQAIDSANQFWTLTNAQHAEMLQAIAETEDVRVLGTTVDRAGRPVVGISALLPRGGTAELHLLISVETGRIVGSETYTLKADSAFPADAVISYRMWDLE